ncbi:MAG: FxSxx-COOH system tetratricopeptide repeat protein [Cyanobacteria bacterium P01_F01_bin.150]
MPDRNPFFTAGAAVGGDRPTREDILTLMQEVLQHQRPVALSGLGGIGKSQLAAEYAHRHRQTYKTVVWLREETSEELFANVAVVAQDLGLPLRQNADQTLVVQALKNWLKDRDEWLLILDNADSLDLVKDWLKLKEAGHIVLATRAAVTEPLAKKIDVETFAPDEGCLFLLRRAGILDKADDLAQASAADQDLAVTLNQLMDSLPLALDQAGAFILETPSSLEEYLALYQAAAPQLLEQESQNSPDHPSATVTFSLAFEQVASQNPAAADLLTLCAFLAPDAIPEELFTAGADYLGEELRAAITDPIKRLQLLRDVGRFSLLSRNPKAQTLDMHRVVQAVLQSRLSPEQQRQWRDRAIYTVNAALPDRGIEYADWVIFERVLPHAQTVIEEIDGDSCECKVSAHLLNQTAEYLWARGQYGTAEPLFQDALTIRQRILDDEHPDIAESLNNLAKVYRSQGRYSDAEPLYCEALAMRKRLFGEEHPDVAQSLNNLAELYRSQGQPSNARPLYHEALEMRKRLFGEEHPDVAQSLNNLAVFYYCQGNYNDAEPLYREALKMSKRLLGDEHPDVATSLNNLAGLYDAQGRYSEAEPLYREALKMRQKLLGKEHPNVATSLNNLALLYKAQGYYRDAEPLYREALEMSKRLLGDEHPDVATSLNNLAFLYASQDRYSEAEPLYREALELSKRLLGDEHPNIATSLNNLALLYNSQGRYSDAEPLFLDALEMSKRLLGDEHPNVATSLFNLGALRYQQGQYIAAQTLLLQAQPIYLTVLGPDHPSTQNLQGWIDDVQAALEESGHDGEA